MEKKLYLLLPYLMVISTIMAQPRIQDASLWVPVDESNIPQTGERGIIPQKYITLFLDTSVFMQTIATDNTISIPMPDGNMKEFVFEISNVIGYYALKLA